MSYHDVLPKVVARVLTERHLWGYLPRSIGPVPRGQPNLALSFDLDYQADTDALIPLVELLGRHGVTATFFSIGALVAQDPRPYRFAFDAGHEIGNHTQTHPDNPVLNPDREFWSLTTEQMADEISRCQTTIAQVTGAAPTGFRTPHFKDHPRMLDALSDVADIKYISTVLASKSPKAAPYFPERDGDLGRMSLFYAAREPSHERPLMVPLTPCPGLRWSPFCSYSSIRRPTDKAAGAGYHDLPQWSGLWKTMLKRAEAQRFASVYFDPMDIMRDEETSRTFEGMLAQALEQGWLISRLDSIAERWRPMAAIAA